MDLAVKELTNKPTRKIHPLMCGVLTQELGFESSSAIRLFFLGITVNYIVLLKALDLGCHLF